MDLDTTGLNPEQRAELELYDKIKKDPWEFLHYVNTQDQVDKKRPIKPFPVNLPYIKLYVRLWEREPLILIPKSRRMKMSWTNIALYTHDTMVNVGRHQAFVSKKEDDSDVLIQRAHFIMKNLDKKLPEKFIPRFEYTFCKLRFPELDSLIEGFPSGADQLRQFTFSGIMGDEMAFWDDAQKAYSASLPTIEGGGRMTLISSPAPGFFKRMVHDKLNEEAMRVSE